MLVLLLEKCKNCHSNSDFIISIKINKLISKLPIMLNNVFLRKPIQINQKTQEEMPRKTKNTKSYDTLYNNLQISGTSVLLSWSIKPLLAS